MPTGVDLSRFKEPITLEEKNAVKKRLGIPLEKQSFSQCGKAGKRKKSGRTAGIFLQNWLEKEMEKT